jgi:hypothetical protein
MASGEVLGNRRGAGGSDCGPNPCAWKEREFDLLAAIGLLHRGADVEPAASAGSSLSLAVRRSRPERHCSGSISSADLAAMCPSYRPTQWPSTKPADRRTALLRGLARTRPRHRPCTRRQHRVATRPRPQAKRQRLPRAGSGATARLGPPFARVLPQRLVEHPQRHAGLRCKLAARVDVGQPILDRVGGLPRTTKRLERPPVDDRVSIRESEVQQHGGRRRIDTPKGAQSGHPLGLILRRESHPGDALDEPGGVLRYAAPAPNGLPLADEHQLRLCVVATRARADAPAAATSSSGSKSYRAASAVMSPTGNWSRKGPTPVIVSRPSDN